MDRKEIGNAGEKLTVNWLINEGYTILATNFYSRYGEIDVIGEKDGVIAFVEVKTNYKSDIRGVWQVTKSKQNKIVKTALVYMQENSVDLQPRFDVANVIYDKNSFVVDYFYSAFDGNESEAR